MNLFFFFFNKLFDLIESGSLKTLLVLRLDLALKEI